MPTLPILDTPEAMRNWSREARKKGQRVGFVPTMGALHAGHAALIDRAHKECDVVVVSIYVNPTQFSPEEDLAKYPRTLDKDVELCAAHGASVVFAPENLYPKKAYTVIEVRELRATTLSADSFAAGPFSRESRPWSRNSSISSSRIKRISAKRMRSNC